MSETGIEVKSQPRVVTDDPPGIAARCQAIREILSDGPSAWDELREGLQARFPTLEVFPLGEDLATLQVGGWVESLPGEPGTYRLVQEPTRGS
jgi:hypothetical protein